MKTLFFPQTLIEPALAEVLRSGFGPLILLHPSREALAVQTAALAEANLIKLVFPCQEDGFAPGAAIEALRRWAAEHAGQDLIGLLRREPEIPFFGADATARIAAEVKSDRSVSPEATAAERLQRARLLLIMAQELDHSRHELVTDFQRLEDQERRMIALLKGEAEAAAAGEPEAGTRPATATPLYMLVERLGAWAQVALAAGDVWEQEPVVWFLTDNRGVLEHITDQAQAETLLDRRFSLRELEALRAWLTDPRDPPPTLASPPPSTSRPLRLTLIRLPQLSRRGWLRRLAGDRSAYSSATDRSTSADGMRVGYVALG